jgi:Flp pilus assembly pilin Flp
MFGRFGKLARDCRGASVMEYSLLVALIAVGLSAGASAIGGANGRGWAALVADVTSNLL